MSSAELAVVLSCKDAASAQVKGFGQSLTALSGAADTASGGVGRLGGVFSTMLGVIGGTVIAGAISNIAGIGKSAIMAGIDFDSMKQQATIAFTTMLGSGEKAQTFLNNLQSFAAATPFEFPGLVTASQRLLAMGFAADQVIPTMTSVGNAVAGLGGGQAEIDRVTTALGQMQAKGKVSSEEMMQLTEAGIPAWKYLAEAIGVDVPTAMAMVTKGAVNAQTGISAVLAGMDHDFAGMMLNQSKSWQGLWSTIKDTATQAAGQVLLPLFDAGTKGMAMLVSAMSGPGFQAGITAMASGLQSGIARMIAIAQTFPAAFMAVFRAIGSGDFNGAFGPILAAVGAAFGPDALAPVTLFVSNLLSAMQRARDIVVTAKQAFSGEWVSADSIATPVRVIGQAFTLLGDGVRTVQGFLAGLPAPVLAVAAGFAALGPALTIAGAALPLLVGAFTGLGPVISFLTSSLPLLGSVIAAVGFPITALVVGVGLLAAAWATNFLGIQTATMPILTAIGAYITGAFLPALTQMGTFLMTTVVPAFVAGWAAIQAGVTTALAAIMPYVTAFIGFLTGQLLPGIQGIIAVAVPALQSFAAAALGAFQAALPGIQAFIGGVMALGAAVLPIIGQIAGMIIGSLGPAIMAIVDWAQVVIPQLGAAWESVWGVIGPVVGQIASFIGATLTTIAGFITSHKEQIVTILQSAWNIISTVIGTAFALITGVISAGLQLISGDWKGAWETIKATAATVWEGIKTVVTNAVELIKTALGLALEGMKTLAANAWTAIETAATSGWATVVTAVTTALTNMKSAVTTGIGTVETEMKGLPGKALAALGNLSGLLVQAGKDLVQGLINGMGSLLGAVQTKASELANAAADAIKGALRINSPSKVMIEYGAGIGEGLMVGMTDRQAETVAVAQAIGLDVAEGMLSGLSSQSGKLGGWLRTIEEAMKGMGSSRLASAKDFLTGALERNSAATLEATLAAVEAYRAGVTNTTNLQDAANGIASNVTSATGAIASSMGSEGTSNANAFATSSSAVVATIKKGIDAFPALDSIKDIPAKVLQGLFEALEGALEYAGQLVDRSDALKEAALEFLANMTAAQRAFAQGQQISVGMGAGAPAISPNAGGSGGSGGGSGGEKGPAPITMNMYGDVYDAAGFQDRVVGTIEQATRRGRLAA